MIQLALNKKLKSANGDMVLDIDLQFGNSELVAIFGKSGAGKTSILRMLAGLLNPDQGRIVVNENVWYDSDKKINLSPQSRKVGMVFQEYALFPNMTVKENLLYALEKNQDAGIVDELIEMVELDDLKDRNPATLSGGQKQRVGLARALVRKPAILMLDEPLSALDSSIRTKLQDYILRVHREYNLTTILVSHDIGEVVKLSDRIYIIDQGKIIKSGKPLEIFSESRISGKFQFTGEILEIRKEDIIYVLTILIGNNIVRIVAEKQEINNMNVGDKVMVISKAFNPILRKIE